MLFSNWSNPSDINVSKYWPDPGLSLSYGGARRSREGLVLLSIEGAGAKHNNCVRSFAGIGHYIFILHRLDLMLLLKTTIQTPVWVAEESGTEGKEEVECCTVCGKSFTRTAAVLSCTHVSKASCFCLYSSRCCLVEEGKLAARTNISQVVKIRLHLSVWGVLTPPRTSASLVWHSTRSRSLLTAGRTGARHPPEAWPKSLICVGCSIASICCASQHSSGMSPQEGEVYCQRKGASTTLLHLCDTASDQKSLHHILNLYLCKHW